VRLIVVDVVPALLRWGDDGQPEVAADAVETMDALYDDYALAALADADRPLSHLRRALEDAGLAEVFESIATSVSFGPQVTPVVVRRLARASGAGAGQVLVATGRPRLADALRRAGIPVVAVTGPDGIAGLPAALEEPGSGPFNP
jgi:hypothetical protein